MKKTKKTCIECKKVRMISSYTGRCSSCLNSNASAMGKLSAEARKDIHKAAHYRAMGKRSAESKRLKKLSS